LIIHREIILRNLFSGFIRCSLSSSASYGFFPAFPGGLAAFSSVYIYKISDALMHFYPNFRKTKYIIKLVSDQEHSPLFPVCLHIYFLFPLS